MADHPATQLPAWSERAACLGRPVRLWFAYGGDDQDQALKVCRGCPVRPDCLEFAVTTGQTHGIWGGLTQDQLARERRRRRQEAG